MLITEENPSNYSWVTHLSPEEKKRPYLVFETTFEDHRLSEIKSCLLDAQETCLTTDQHPFCEAESRTDLIVYFKDVLKCIEAAFLIARMIRLFETSIAEESPK
jgi:hypothetical protein